MTVEISDLTSTEVDGAGVFDKLMTSVASHLKEEYTSQRLRGPEYANVYASAIQSAISQGVQFLQTQAQIALIEQQVEKTKADTDKAKIDVEIANSQKLKIDEEVLNLAKLREKIDAEIALFVCKKKTELAQTDGAAFNAGSILGKQSVLYDNQAKGYIRDSEQKVLKMMLDVWGIQRTTDNAIGPNIVNRLQDINIGNAIETAFEGAGMTVSTQASPVTGVGTGTGTAGKDCTIVTLTINSFGTTVAGNTVNVNNGATVTCQIGSNFYSTTVLNGSWSITPSAIDSASAHETTLTATLNDGEGCTVTKSFSYIRQG